MSAREFKVTSLYYNISTKGRETLRSLVRQYQPLKMMLNEDLEYLPVYPTELEMLEDFSEVDHGMDIEEIKTRFGSEGVKTFRRLHKAGYISGEGVGR